MKKKITLDTIGAWTFVFLVAASTILILFNSTPTGDNAMNTPSPLFDTTIIDAQGAITYDDDKGRIRIVHAWGFNKDENLVEDETGNLWDVDVEFEHDEALLLMIADNNTPNDLTDDYVLRVWREA